MTGPESRPQHHETPAASRAARSPEEMRAELGTLRAELGDTVEELAHRVDVPSRVRAKREETTARIQEQVTQARALIAKKAPTVKAAVRDRPALLAGIALVLSYLLLSRRLRRRSRRKAARAAEALIGRDENGTR